MSDASRITGQYSPFLDFTITKEDFQRGRELCPGMEKPDPVDRESSGLWMGDFWIPLSKRLCADQHHENANDCELKYEDLLAYQAAVKSANESRQSTIDESRGHIYFVGDSVWQQVFETVTQYR